MASQTKPVSVNEGIHKGVPPHLLPGGYASEIQNFYPHIPGYVEPRSGLSQGASFNFNGPVLGAAEVFDIQGASCGFAPSALSFSFRHPENQGWSALSYVPSSGITTMRDAPSGTSTDYWRTESIYDLGTDTFIAVASNNTNSIKFFTVASGTTTFSDFSWIDSLDSTLKARDVVAVNDRLVFFNTESSDGTRFPQRVLWSARGDAKNYAIASEAGFEDLLDMRGEGQAAVRFRDFLLLFTEYEIWRATPTLDSYAFRFDRVVDNVGCPFPKTIATTPNGVIFMEHDREVYITDGSSIAPLGPIGGDGPSRIQRILLDDAVNMDRAWGIYNHAKNRYELYYTASDSAEGYPRRALFYDLSKRSWWPQVFSWDVSSGVDMYDPTAFVTYDEVDVSYDSTSLEYDAYDVKQKNRRVNLFSSMGTIYAYRSSQTNDSGAAIDARLRLPGFRTGDHRQVHLTELWVDFENASSSSASVFVGDVREGSSSFSFVKSITLSTAPVHVPLWKTSRAPTMELRISDGGQPKLTLFVATLKDASRF